MQETQKEQEKNTALSSEADTDQRTSVSDSHIVPKLSNTERREVERRARISAVVLHETVREEGERELRRRPLALACSGLAAGLSMGFSLMSQGLLHAYLPAASWTPLIDNLGYSVGFLIVVLGRQQLFTENTLTAILPLLAHFNLSTFMRVARLWAIVLVANLLGAFIFSAVIAHTSLFSPTLQQSFSAIAHHSLRGGFALTVLRGIFAGWLIALMVWLLPASEGTKMHIIILLTYLVSLGGLAHIIAGSVDVLYLVNTGSVSWLTYFVGFMFPTLIGNIIGGASLVAALNFAQVATETVGSEYNSSVLGRVEKQ
jgi:formate/nitrite transporter FocA (FNT family)